MSNKDSQVQKDFYVYAYIDPRTEKPFYIGKGKGKRKFSHLRETFENTLNKRKWRYIKGLKNKGLEPAIILLRENLTNEEAYDLEEKFIEQYGRLDIDEGGILTNICVSNRPPIRTGIRKPHTEETKALISKKGKGRRTGDKHPMYGKPGKRGEENGMFGKSYLEVWIKKYGIDEANRLNKIRSEKIKRSSLGRKPSTQTLERLKISQKDANRGRIWISNDILRKQKFIWPEEISIYSKEDGWYKGKTAYNVRKEFKIEKTKWINNGEIRTRIPVNDPIMQGWVKGRGSFKTHINNAAL